MNQILSTKLKSNKNINKKHFFKFQFILSIILIFLLIVVFVFYINSLNKKQKISNNLISNYNIYKLYSNQVEENVNDTSNENNLFGIIEIPKINIYYPIFSETTEEFLKIAPCKFYGNSLDLNDNICIAGHNYNNSLFFSNINNLSPDDVILIYNNTGKKYIYYVFDIYEVKSSDLSPVYNYDKNSKELTLITCNNLNNNRIIVKAKQEQE